MTTRQSIVLLVIFAVAACQTQVITAAIPFIAVCKTVSGEVNFEFCMESLGPDGRSANADSYQDFSLIAVDLLAANVTSTKAKIDGLLRGGGQDAATARCLQSCQGIYDGVAQGLPGCSDEVKDGKFANAMASLEQSATHAKECEDGFGKSNVASPLTAEDDDAFQLAGLAVALVRQASYSS